MCVCITYKYIYEQHNIQIVGVHVNDSFWILYNAPRIFNPLKRTNKGVASSFVVVMNSFRSDSIWFCYNHLNQSLQFQIFMSFSIEYTRPKKHM